MNQPISLPAPSPEESEQSQRLANHIRAEIDARGGAISFRRFMEMALYFPGLGYYMSGVRKFGSAGDFVTAPEISSLFGRCVARQCAQVLEICPEKIILEAGAGTGMLAADILIELNRIGRLPTRYRILELSGSLREQQRQTLSSRVPQWIDRIEWLDAIPEAPFTGVILANELLDALPANILRIDADKTVERFVGLHEEQFEWRDDPPENNRLIERAEGLRNVVPPGYQTEFNLSAEAWVSSLAPKLQKGLLLLIDYGFPAREFYHPDRATGTLMCHYRHLAHPDPLTLVGLQDVTTHVDFTAIAQAGHDVGFHVAGFTTQASFLLALGLAPMALEPEDENTRWRMAQQVQHLTSPAEMGELFKVLALTRDVDLPLSGFSLVDHRHRL